ncbi:helix-turn-helix domain-containing protein [Legionella jamestowniensis]|uniref:Antitoxin HigA n=2 Tax=Legionella jamestowniensis TaxID=455 RepID=A0A0W0UN38_9GAMM|nr:helix-turn-helix transcriptional regulator [Legionella jamestowniensis]KTD09283.1 Antitoxin HigA [Legionella jamestowniensis]OCH99309.1 XRE family transcriptional regulator [Legionella jamestowniensis]SFL87010.1 Helix-turn-helix [Legionella jamestowniensis DSM 19215]
MSIQNLKKRALQNLEVKAEYEGLNEEFALIDTLLTMHKKSGLSQEEIARKVGTQKSNISRLEKGVVNSSWKTLQKYAHACGFEISMKVKNLNSEHHR